MLDVHILIHPATPKDWVAHAIDSTQAAACCAGYPVAVHTLPAVVGHIGQGRAKGYAMGHHPYVTSVDDDDWLDADAFALLADALAEWPQAIVTRCQMHQNGKRAGVAARDNLRVFRRDVAMGAPLTEWPVYDGPMLLARVEPVRLDCAAYHYRLHVSPHRRQMAQLTPDARARVRSAAA